MHSATAKSWAFPEFDARRFGGGCGTAGVAWSGEGYRPGGGGGAREWRGRQETLTLGSRSVDMAVRRRKRDPRYSRAIGTKPYVGRRYVVNRRVRIEWTDAKGKRRSRSIGPNNTETRERADAKLEEILMQLQKVEREQTNVQSEGGSPVAKALKNCAVFVMDSADQLYDWISSVVKDFSGGSDASEEQATEVVVDEDAPSQDTPDQEGERTE